MSQHPEESSGLRDPLRATLENLVMPVFEEFACWDQDGPMKAETFDEDGQLSLCGMLDGDHLVCVIPLPIDHQRTILRFELEMGGFLEDFEERAFLGERALLGQRALLLGALLDDSLYHVRWGLNSPIHGKIRIACDFTVRSDDRPLVFQRTAQMMGLGNFLEWYFALHLPERLSFRDLAALQNAWEDHAGVDLGVVLDRALEAPPLERPVENLLRIAQGLGRWKDVLRLLAEHPDQRLAAERTRLKIAAHRMLGQWIPAIETAEAAGLHEDCDAEKELRDPNHMLALIESGREIEALRLLGAASEGDFGGYDWLRALALRRAGFKESAEEAFERYRKAYPGDLFALGWYDL